MISHRIIICFPRLGHPVFLDREEVGKMGYRIVLANVMAEDEVTAKVRHDPQRLARVLWRWYAKK